MYKKYIYLKAISTIFVTLMINVIFITSLNAQFFIPIGITDSTVTQPTNPPIGKPYGGGSGYFPIIKSEESDIVINTNDFNFLKNAIANASYGDTIYINDNLQIEIPAEGTLTIPDGVTLASGRGRNGSQGALIYTNYLEQGYGYNYPALSVGNDVQITGLRLRGPDSTSSSINYGKAAVAIMQYYRNNLEVHNCEIYNWYVYGIFLTESDNANIHHNYIHNNQNPHIGYGICNRNKTDTMISYNIFNRNRHDIAGIKNTNMEPPSYTAQHNLIGPDGINHSFDMHGCGYTDLWGCPDMYTKDDAGPENLAGETINILYNYFLPMNIYPKHHSVVIRGIPRDMANIIGNYFPTDFANAPDYPVRQTLMWGSPINSECKPINTSYEWNSAGGTNPLNNGDCVYNGILQSEPNHINLVDNIIGHPIYIRVINWDYQSSNPVWKIVGPEIKFTNLDVSSFAYGDFNNDGRTDILYQDYISWSGLTEWETHTEYHTIDYSHIIDFNGDGIEDKLNIVHPNTIWP